MKTRAFTLIELMIVVAIIALLVAIAIPNILKSRMAANETSAIVCCKLFGEAEEIYKRTDYNKNGIFEYAQRLSGVNSLLENTAGMHDLGLIDSNFGNAEGQPGTTTAKAGYVFTVLTGQGAAAAGGAYSYISTSPSGISAMTLGYGICALPQSYDISGRSAYMANQVGVVWQKDRGTTGVHETTFNPDNTWTVSQ